MKETKGAKLQLQARIIGMLQEIMGSKFNTEEKIAIEKGKLADLLIRVFKRGYETCGQEMHSTRFNRLFAELEADDNEETKQI